MNATSMLIGQVFSISIILATFHYTGNDPRVMVYTFVLLALARFTMVEALLALYKWVGLARPYLSYFCSPPRTKAKPNLIYEKGTDKPAGDWGYFGAVIFLGTIVFFLIDTQDHDMTLEKWGVAFKWVLIYTTVYWIQDLFNRITIIDFKKQHIVNLAYNMGNVIVLFIAVMIGFILFAYFAHGNIPPSSPWIIAGPLLVVKHLYDFVHWRFKKLNLKVRWEIG